MRGCHLDSTIDFYFMAGEEMLPQKQNTIINNLLSLKRNCTTRIMGDFIGVLLC
jgi:hypothetical protein